MALGTTLANLVIMVRDEARLSSSTSQGIDHLAYIKRLLRRTHTLLCDSYEWEHLRLKRDNASVPLVANQQFYNFPQTLNTDRPFVAYLNLKGVWTRLEPGIDPERYNEIDSYNGGRGDPLLWDWSNIQSTIASAYAARLITCTFSSSIYEDHTVFGSYDSGVTWTDITEYISPIPSPINALLKWEVSPGPLSTTPIQFKRVDALGVETTPTFTGLAVTLQYRELSGEFEVWPVPSDVSKLITGTLPAPLNAGDVFYGSLDSGSTWANITDTLSGLSMSWVAAPASLATVQFQKISSTLVTTPITMTGLTLTVTDRIAFEGTQRSFQLINDSDRASVDDILLSLQVAGEILVGNNQEAAAKIVLAAANTRLSQVRASKSNASRIVIGGSPDNTGRRPSHPKYVTAR